MAVAAMAQAQTDTTAVHEHGENCQHEHAHTLRDAHVHAFRSKRSRGLEMKDIISKHDLTKAACCNLGESFQNSASVDVAYADAATGVKMVKLLGLSGTYVQMLTENVPNFRGAALPYALGYVPGPWMQAIQVSKGASSVKAGYEGITGQINVDYLRTQNDDSFHANAYLASDLKLDVNLDGNIHLKNDAWSSGLLLHFEDRDRSHDGNDDGFSDKPLMKQVNLMNKWTYEGDHYTFHLNAGYLYEDRNAGQTKDCARKHAMPRYSICNKTSRLDLQTKQAFIIDHEHGRNIALMGNYSLHNQDNIFGNRSWKYFDVDQQNVYGALVYEENITDHHQISAGLNIRHDRMDESFYCMDPLNLIPANHEFRETTPGLYAQYTLQLHDELTLMAGLRYDHSSLFGSFVTPRVNLRYKPAEWFTLRASAGKGYRTTHIIAENHMLMAGGLHIEVPGGKTHSQDEAWNYGASMQFNIPVGKRKIEFNVDYFYTDFQKQMVCDMDQKSLGNHHIKFYDLNGRSFSHALQFEASVEPINGLTLDAAWRMNRVRTTYADGRLRETPLTSRYKGLLSASYTTEDKLWQFDLNCQLNGPGRMPDAYKQLDGTMSWDEEYKAFPQLSAQVTRNFGKHWSVYVGGENLTNFRQKQPIINSHTPWQDDFDATMVWGPVEGAMGYVGIRYNL